MAERIPQIVIQELLTRNDIVEIIQSRVQIKKKGKNYQGLCPFHDEKSPSFSVNQEKQFYYCFGCGAHGNTLSFLMNYDHMEFLDAIEYLAVRAGIEIKKEHSAQTESFKHLYPLLEQANAYYQSILRDSPDAINFLKNRGLDGKTAKQFDIGFVREGWDGLLKTLGTNSKSIEALSVAGMLIAKDHHKGYYDRFRHRIMFPIRNTRGQVIAFGGRSINEQQPKYLNSPETPIFHKSAELYGLYESRLANHNPESFIIVEGYMDVVSLYQFGITNAVATLGTAVNARHAQKLLRYTNKLIFCFDGDKAGQAATWKALTICLPLLRDGVHIHFLYLPEGEDPDSFVRQFGREKFLEKANNAASLEDIFFKILKKQHSTDSIDGKAHLAKKAQDYIMQMPKGLFRELMQQRLANEIDVNVQQITQMNEPSIEPKIKEAPSLQKGLSTQVRHSLSLLLHNTSAAQQIDGEKIDALAKVEQPGMDILLKIIVLLKELPMLTVGELLAVWEDPEQKHLIASCAAADTNIPSEGVAAELIDTISKILRQNSKQLIDKLIKKAKTCDLSLDEKKQLNDLINKS